MKALRFYKAGDLRVDDIAEPECGPDQVMIKPAFVGICGTDLEEYVAGPVVTPASPHPLTNEQLPVTLGHEFSATVEYAGANVKQWKSGDKVIVFPLMADYSCGACLRGHPNSCLSQGSIGFSSANCGGFAEKIVVPADALYKLPERLSLEEGALAEPLSVAWHATTRAKVRPDDPVLVIGAGPVGLGVLQVLKAQGVKTIIVSERSELRRRFAQNFGATHVVDPTSGTALDEVRGLSRGEGVAVVFDAAGVQPGLDFAIAASRVGATIVNIALWKNPATINSVLLILGEKKYIGTMTYLRKDFEGVIEAMGSGALNPKEMITSVVPLEKAVTDGFDRLLQGKETDVKTLISIQA